MAINDLRKHLYDKQIEIQRYNSDLGRGKPKKGNANCLFTTKSINLNPKLQSREQNLIALSLQTVYQV